MISIILSIGVSWGACGSPTTVQQVSTAMDEASLAFATMDEDGFGAASSKASEALGCLGTPLPPAKAAAYHRMEGLRLFLAGDPDNATLEFGAALRIEPDYALSAKIAPEGGKLWRLYDAGKEIPESSPASFGVPSGVKAWVDGAETRVRPTDVPAIVQVGADATHVSWTAVVLPGSEVQIPASALPAPVVSDLDEDDELDTPKRKVKDDDLDDEPKRKANDDDLDDEPKRKAKDDDLSDDEPKKRASEDDDEDVVKKPKGEKKPFNKMWIGVGASAAVAAGLFGASMATNDAFARQLEAGTPSKGTYDANHATFYGSVGMAGVTVVLAGIAIGGSL